jgi:hypothetical protein
MRLRADVVVVRQIGLNQAANLQGLEDAYVAFALPKPRSEKNRAN